MGSFLLSFIQILFSEQCSYAHASMKRASALAAPGMHKGTGGNYGQGRKHYTLHTVHAMARLLFAIWLERFWRGGIVFHGAVCGDGKLLSSFILHKEFEQE